MRTENLRPFVSNLMLLNLCMYCILLAIGVWSANEAVQHGFTMSQGGFPQPAHFSPLAFPIGNAATGFFVVIATIAGTLGTASVFAGVNHVRFWTAATLPSTVNAAWIAWSLPCSALILAWKEKELQHRDACLRTMEALVVALTFSQLLYIVFIHGAQNPRDIFIGLKEPQIKAGEMSS